MYLIGMDYLLLLGTTWFIKMSDLYGIYARVSTDDQNVEQQIQLLKDYAKRNKILIRTYNDFDVSGITIPINERPAGKLLLKDLENGKIKGIIVSKWDRITRTLRHGIDFLDYWDIHKFKWLSIYDGEFLGTPDHIFTFKLKCLLSEHEINQLKWRSQIGIERAKLEGKYKGRKKGAKGKKVKGEIKENGGR